MGKTQYAMESEEKNCISDTRRKATWKFNTKLC